jgi:hypothetical protein
MLRRIFSGKIILNLFKLLLLLILTPILYFYFLFTLNFTLVFLSIILLVIFSPLNPRLLSDFLSPDGFIQNKALKEIKDILWLSTTHLLTFILACFIIWSTSQILFNKRKLRISFEKVIN